MTKLQTNKYILIVDIFLFKTRNLLICINFSWYDFHKIYRKQNTLLDKLKC